MTAPRTLFVSYQHRYWTEEQLDDAAEQVEEALPGDVRVVLTPESIDYMTADEVEAFVGDLVEAVS